MKNKKTVDKIKDIRKLFYCILFSLCLQVKALHPNQESFFLERFDSCYNLIKKGEEEKASLFYGCVADIKRRNLQQDNEKYSEYLKNLELFKNFIKVESLCLTKEEEILRPDPICPMPFPLFKSWVEDYKALCFETSNEQSLDPIRPGPICPIPLPLFQSWAKDYELFCSPKLKEQSLDPIRPGPICPIPLPLFENYDLFCPPRNFKPYSKQPYPPDPLCQSFSDIF